MGAYYNAALKYPEKEKFYRYSCWKMDNGAKLLEHSYLDNNYVNAIIRMIHFRPAHVVWLCDYHDQKGLNWGEIPDLRLWRPRKNHPLYLCLIVNLFKKEYVNTRKIIDLIVEDISKFIFTYSYLSENEYKNKIYIEVYHPLPFLTNSSEYYMGGGDYPDDYKYRTRWKCDLIVSLPLECEPELKLRGFQDITEISLVPIESGYRISDLYEAFLFLRKLAKQVGVDDIKGAVKVYFEKKAFRLRADHKKISEFFKKWTGTESVSSSAKTQLQFAWTTTTT